MSARLRAAAWVAAYGCTLGALVAGVAYAPWPTCLVLALAALAALVWVLRHVHLGGP